jgi:hypothetical protein
MALANVSPPPQKSFESRLVSQAEKAVNIMNDGIVFSAALFSHLLSLTPSFSHLSSCSESTLSASCERYQGPPWKNFILRWNLHSFSTSKSIRRGDISSRRRINSMENPSKATNNSSSTNRFRLESLKCLSSAVCKGRKLSYKRF